MSRHSRRQMKGIPEDERAHPGGEEELEARVRALGRSSGARGKEPRGGRKGRRWRLAVMFLLLLAVLCGIYAIVSAAFGGQTPSPATVVVREGDTLTEVADELERTGVVGSSTLFKARVRLEGGGPGVQPGEYRLERGASVEEILATLSSEEEDVSTYAVTIPEGLTIRQTAEAVEQAGGVPAAEFESAASETDYGYGFLEDPAIQRTEGFLFPKSYDFEKGTEARTLVNRMLEQYLIETSGLDFAEARERLDLTEYQLVVVASLVEKESANSEERPIIASVIYNRLRQDMPLQIDASVQYAIGDPREKLSLVDLEVESPYNTYENRGLPPGPIASPSRESLLAALEPARTDHLYYVLEVDGERHFFTDDYDAFLAAKAEAGR